MINKAGYVKEFSSPVGPTGLSGYQHAEATGLLALRTDSIAPGSKEKGGELEKARFFKTHSFALSASDYRMPGCLCVCIVFVLPHPRLYSPPHVTTSAGFFHWNMFQSV